MIYIGSDHGGFDLKQELLNYIANELKLDIKDMGCFSKDSVDYPDIAKELCPKVLEDKNNVGILICTTGIGISISANKYPGIRCALCHESFSASMTRRHNDTNVLALGGGIIGINMAKDIVDKFLNTDFEGGRHQRRVDKIMSIEEC